MHKHWLGWTANAPQVTNRHFSILVMVVRSTKSEFIWREQEGKTSCGLASPGQSLENPHTPAAGEVALRNKDAVSPVLMGALGLEERHFEINVLQA